LLSKGKISSEFEAGSVAMANGIIPEISTLIMTK